MTKKKITMLKDFILYNPYYRFIMLSVLRVWMIWLLLRVGLLRLCVWDQAFQYEWLCVVCVVCLAESCNGDRRYPQALTDLDCVFAAKCQTIMIDSTPCLRNRNIFCFLRSSPSVVMLIQKIKGRNGRLHHNDLFVISKASISYRIRLELIFTSSEYCDHKPCVICNENVSR